MSLRVKLCIPFRLLAKLRDFLIVISHMTILPMISIVRLSVKSFI